MGRTRKGRDISGWLMVDKPAGVTSTAVVNKVRWAFEAKKAGHAGTLDPDATGLLPVALGEATKTIAYLGDALKAYEFTVKWGAQTTTDDAEGKVIETSGTRPSEAGITAALPQFIGDIQQVPPQYSAVKVDGNRAYDIARGGETMELAARDLYVDELTLLSCPDADHAVFRLVCSAGGYVRAIARDLGRALGCFGHVVTLRRTWSGPFDAEDGIGMDTIEALARTPGLDAHLRPVEDGLADLPMVTATPEGAARLRNGNPGMVIASGVEYGAECWAAQPDGRALAVGRFRAGALHPSRVFNR